MCAMYRKKVPFCPSNNPPQHFMGLWGARASERVGASWLSDIDAGAKVYLRRSALQVMLVSRHVLTRTWQQCLQTWPQNSYGQLWKSQRMPHPARKGDLDCQCWEWIARRSYRTQAPRAHQTFEADDFAPKLFWNIIATMRVFHRKLKIATIN